MANRSIPSKMIASNVMYYVTSVFGINLRTYNSKRVQIYGPVAPNEPELYRPHLAAERVELAR